MGFRGLGVSGSRFGAEGVGFGVEGFEVMSSPIPVGFSKPVP